MFFALCDTWLYMYCVNPQVPQNINSDGDTCFGIIRTRIACVCLASNICGKTCDPENHGTLKTLVGRRPWIRREEVGSDLCPWNRTLKTLLPTGFVRWVEGCWLCWGQHDQPQKKIKTYPLNQYQYPKKTTDWTKNIKLSKTYSKQYITIQLESQWPEWLESGTSPWHVASPPPKGGRAGEELVNTWARSLSGPAVWRRTQQICWGCFKLLG